MKFKKPVFYAGRTLFMAMALLLASGRTIPAQTSDPNPDATFSPDKKEEKDERKEEKDKKLKTFQYLSKEEALRFFKSLSDQEKINVLVVLDQGKRLELFLGLNKEEKIFLFGKLDAVQQAALFRSLSQNEQELVFNGLNVGDRAKIFNSLSETKKKEWLQKYPDLEPAVKGVAPSPNRQAAGPSDIEKIMSGSFPEDISRQLSQFGYDFFSQEGAALTALSNVPVGPDYIIGPGDNFTINLWGLADGAYNVTVNRDGSITLPRLGTLNIGGLSFAELKNHLRNKFREQYPTFEMSIIMGSLRTVEVFIIGEVKFPGTYSVSSLSTVITALFAAGGPTKKGGLRSIQVSRKNEAPRFVDLYDFLVKGDKNSDLHLQPGDTIFVPVLGAVAGIAGCVKRPAVYELKGAETIGDLVQLAGGILPISHLQNIVMERVEGNEKRVIKSFNLDPNDPDARGNLKMSVRDFDIVKIYPLFKTIQQVVYLAGHVKYPREYELKAGMKLSDIIPSYDVLLPEPHLPQAEIMRLIQPDLQPVVIPFDLGGLLAGDTRQNLLLQNRDRVIVYDQWSKNDMPQVTIKGEVRNPGMYRLYSGMTIKDLVFQAGNLTDKAYLEKVDLVRIDKGGSSARTVKMTKSLQKVLQNTGADNLELQRNDAVYVRSIPQYTQALERKVSLEGEFGFPGEYVFSEGERLGTVIRQAGGLTGEGYAFGAVFLRESVKEVQKQQLKDYVSRLEQDILGMSSLQTQTAMDKDQAALFQQELNIKKQLLEKLKQSEPTGRMVINLQDVLDNPASRYNFELRAGDRLIVAKKADNVNVMGEVYNPTALLVEKGQTVGFYLSQVGGITDKADRKQIYVVKANGSVVSKRQGGNFSLLSWDKQKHQWSSGGFDSMPLDPGDTIIVPPKMEKGAWMRFAKDLTEIVYKIAVGAGVLKTIGVI